MAELPLHSTKFDGSLHYRFLTREVARSAAQLIAHSAPGSPVESYRGTTPGEMHLLSFFWPDVYYNLHICWHHDWRPKNLYVNIATPATWHDGVIRYVDLDLDLILHHGADAPVLDDEDEFDAHRVRWSYPAALVERCYAAVEEVRGRFTARDWPFTPDLFSWRPGMSLP